ncbi:hypothetical protein D3C85_1222460 [compost metagenome]
MAANRGKAIERALAVIPLALERTRLHELEAQRQRAFHRAGLHGLARQEQRAGTGGAVVVDVDDGNARHAYLVQRGLAAGGIAIDVANECLLDLVVRQARILERQLRGRGAHHAVRLALARLLERDHADPGYHYML